MKEEIEVKFANVEHDNIREILKHGGAKLVQTNRMMRRVIVHTSAMSKKDAFIRVRDEGYRVTLTYKQFDADSIDGAKEYEVMVSDFDETIAILGAGGLKYDVFQESKRENWELNGVEIMLDEWPWLNPYIEIEGMSKEVVIDIAKMLGFDWKDSIFGGVANLYLNQYPQIGKEGINTINHDWKVIRFNDPKPDIIS